MIPMQTVKYSFRRLMLAGVVALAGCASQPATAPDAVAIAGPAPVATAQAPLSFPTAFQTVGAISEAQSAAVISAFNAALAGKLAGCKAACKLLTAKDRPTRVLLDADLAFEVGSAQLRPELLLPLADAVVASRSAGAWVIHVIGHSDAEADAGLAERRATAVAAYLSGQGVAGGRLRAEGRAARDGATRRVELVFAPIIEGREVRAWMPPEGAR